MSQQRRLRLPHDVPVLTMAPLAWLKLQFFCHAGDTEIGGFGVSAENDLLYVEDFMTVKQEVSIVTVSFDDSAVADWFDRCVDLGIHPRRCGRIWLHTHPGESVDPSSKDEETFDRIYGRCDWSVMFILGRTGRTYARLALSAGPAASLLLPVQVDWSSWPLAATGAGSMELKVQEWKDEYAANIQPRPDPFMAMTQVPTDRRFFDEAWDHHPWLREMMGEFLMEDTYDREFARGSEAARREATRDHTSRPFD